MPKKEKVVFEGTPVGSWMVTFSDMNTLLLTFFVLLFSMSSLSTDTFDEMFKPSKGDSLGLLNEDTRAYASKLIFDPRPVLPKGVVRSALNVFRDESDIPGETINIPDGVQFDIIDAETGVLSIVLADRLLYAPGQTTLSEESREFLTKFRRFLHKIFDVLPRRVVIEGHTDNTAPEEERFVVSAQRAEAVLEFILADNTMPPALFSIVGYGSTRPIVENTSDENRAINRRVRIVLEPEEDTARNVNF